jgi:hypothetical protein
MPALPAVPKVVRFDVKHTIGPDVNVLDHYFLQYSGAMSVADLTTVINTAITAWNTNMKAQENANTTLTQITGTDLTSASAPQVVVAASVTGTNVAQAAPGSAAHIIRFRIARRFRGGHPRFMHGGVSVNELANSQTFTAGDVAAELSAWQAFIAAAIAAPPAAVGTLLHVAVSYFAGFTNKTFPSGRTRPVPTVRAVPLVDAVQSYTVNTKIGTIRRRLQLSP